VGQGRPMTPDELVAQWDRYTDAHETWADKAYAEGNMERNRWELGQMHAYATCAHQLLMLIRQEVTA